MVDVRKTEEFDDWLLALKDHKAVAKIVARIERLALGNPGDVKPVGEGISEMRIPYGPGYRVYYTQTGKEVVLLFVRRGQGYAGQGHQARQGNRR